jgi:hypothetical protein
MNFKFRSQRKSSESYLFGIIDILTEYKYIFVLILVQERKPSTYLRVVCMMRKEYQRFRHKITRIGF